MKFKYDLSKNYYEIFDESQGIVNFRNEIKRNRYAVKRYTDRCKTYAFMTFFILIAALLFQVLAPYAIITDIIWIAFALCTALVVMIIFVFVFSYKQQRKLLCKGEIEFSKKGITDVSESGLTTGVTWDLVDFVVITDTVVVILTKTHLYFHFGQDLIDDVLLALNKFNKDIQVYDVSIYRYRDKVLKELIENNKKEAAKKEKEESKKKKEKSVKDIKEIEQDIIKEIESPKYEDYKDEEAIKE